MNLLRETGASLGMRNDADLVEVHLGQFGYGKSEPESKSNPIAQGVTESKSASISVKLIPN